MSMRELSTEEIIQLKDQRFKTFLVVFNALIRDGYGVKLAMVKAKSWEDYYTDGIEGD